MVSAEPVSVVAVTLAPAVVGLYPPMFVPSTVHTIGGPSVSGTGRSFSSAAVGEPVKTICWPTTAVGLGNLAVGPLMMGLLPFQVSMIRIGQQFYKKANRIIIVCGWWASIK